MVNKTLVATVVVVLGVAAALCIVATQSTDTQPSPRNPMSRPDATPQEALSAIGGQPPVTHGAVPGRKAAHYTQLSMLTPVPGDAVDVINSLTPAAKAGDMSAALAIYMKANDCRLRTEEAQRRAPSSVPSALTPTDCEGLAPEDYTAAGKWLETAADAGNVDAQFLYAASADGVLGPPVDWLRYPEAVARFKRKAMGLMNQHASQGSIDALLYLSNAYEYGVLTDRDPVKALAYYRAVELSDTSAVSQRALAYLQQNLSPTQLRNAEQQARSIHANCCE